MPLMYFSAVEWVRKRNFEVGVPRFYHPYLPEDMKNPTPKPLEKVNRFRPANTKRRMPIQILYGNDPDELQSASYPVEIMLDMFQKKIEFQLVMEEDVVEILDGLDRYLVSLKFDVETGNESATNYAKLVIRWRAEVYKHYYRYMETHPEAKRSLYPNGDPTKNLVHLMMLSGGVQGGFEDLDPLLAKARPPYTIEELTTKDPEVSRETEIANSLGLPSVDHSEPDNITFDFQEFLKGR